MAKRRRGAPREAFAQLRMARGFSQELAAEDADVSKTTIYRLEAGVGQPRIKERPALAKTYGLTLGEFNDILARSDETQALPLSPNEGFPMGEHRALIANRKHLRGNIGELSRRELMRVIGLGCGVLAASDVDFSRLQSALQHSHHLDARILDDLAVVNKHLWAAYRSARNKYLIFEDVLAHFESLLAALRNTSSDKQRQPLCALISDLAQLGGEIAFDAGLYTDAGQCYALAIHAATQAHAGDLKACALVRHAFLPIYEGNYDLALPILEAATKVAGKYGDPAFPTLPWVATVRAEVHSRLGNEAGCLAALDEAQTIADFSPAASYSASWLRFSSERFVAERGSCLVKLGRSDLAESALHDALRGHPTPTRRRGMILSDVALAAAMRRDLDQACTLGQSVLDIANEGSTAFLTRRLDDVALALYPYREERMVASFLSRRDAMSQELCP